MTCRPCSQCQSFALQRSSKRHGPALRRFILLEHELTNYSAQAFSFRLPFGPHSEDCTPAGAPAAEADLPRSCTSSRCSGPPPRSACRQHALHPVPAEQCWERSQCSSFVSYAADWHVADWHAAEDYGTTDTMLHSMGDNRVAGLLCAFRTNTCSVMSSISRRTLTAGGLDRSTNGCVNRR